MNENVSITINVQRGNIITFLEMAEEIAKTKKVNKKKINNMKVVLKFEELLIYDSSTTRFLHRNHTYVRR